MFTDRKPGGGGGWKPRRDSCNTTEESDEDQGRDKGRDTKRDSGPGQRQREQSKEQREWDLCPSLDPDYLPGLCSGNKERSQQFISGDSHEHSMLSSQSIQGLLMEASLPGCSSVGLHNREFQFSGFLCCDSRG